MKEQNMVDERFECLAVVFRLAGKENYGDLELEYQRKVAEKFSDFIRHPAVEFIKNSVNLGYDSVLRFAVHIEKKDGKFTFINDINSLFAYAKWDKTLAESFLPLLNDFYIQANYAEFYNSQIPYFMEATKIFYEDFYGSINWEWFKKYIPDITNLRCIYSLSSGNYSATVNDKYIYGCVWKKQGPVIIHEFCHSFTNEIAEKWYRENSEFRNLCDKSVNTEKHPFYPKGESMAREYITTAYEIMYFNENEHHGYAGDENFVFYEGDGLPDIRKVYDMICKQE